METFLSIWNLGQEFFSRKLVQDFLVNVFGALIGVFAAFRLERWWERRQSRHEYALLLDTCIYDLGSLHGICKQIRKQVAVGSTSMLQIEAPVLEAILKNPILHEYGSHGLIMSLTSLSGLVSPTGNVMNHYRFMSAMGRPITEQGVMDTQNRMDQLVRLIEYVQSLLDDEFRKLKVGVIRTAADKQIVQEIAQVLKSEEPSPSKSPPA
jgi:hypothetical protein